jgi:HAMP domain-containing protein
MKWIGKHSFLGVAVGERTIAVAEVGPARGGGGGGAGGTPWEVRRAAEFQPPADDAAGGDKDAGTARAFSAFLREHGFSSSRAVVGVPARWLVAREREVPPSSPEQAAEVLRMQAERLFSAELGDLAVDYAGTPDASEPRGVLLMAMPRRQLERVVKLLGSAGREVVAVMPSTLALADAVAGDVAADHGGGADGLVLSLGGDAVELAAHRGGAPRLLRHLPVRGPDLTSRNGTRAAAVSHLAGEIRRTVAMMPRGTRPEGGIEVPADALHLWDGVGLDAQDASTIARQAGLELRGADAALPALGSGDGAMTPFAPAVALALAGARRAPGAVDFLHPRLAAPRKRRLGRRGAWALALTATAVLALLAFWYDVRSREGELADLRTRLDASAPQVKAAEQTAQRIGTARAWYPEGRFAALDCLRAIADAFPDGGEAIYVLKFTLPESRDGTFSGKAPDRKLVFDVVERLNASGQFANAKAVYTLDAGGSSTEVAFSITFTYLGTPGGLARPTTAPTAPAQTADRQTR